MELSSPAFTNGGDIPSRYTCEGQDTAPPLAWSGLPEGTRSLALVVDDPDAPDTPHPPSTRVHWVLEGNAPPPAGRPQSAGERGGRRAAGPPQGATAPSGGSDPHEVGERGGLIAPAGIPAVRWCAPRSRCR